MKQYLELLRDIDENGSLSGDRTGVGTISMFGPQYRVDLSKGFPLLTTKKIFWKGVVKELFWILSGSTDNNDLVKEGVHIWDEWATPEMCAKFSREPGDLGPVYGHQWRRFGATHIRNLQGFPTGQYYPDGVDQIRRLVNDIKSNPNSRRLIVTGWNPEDADLVALPPCHTLFQMYVRDGKLSCKLYQRSADFLLGVPFNLASYALLTHLIAHECGLKVGDFVHSFGDAHIYCNHTEQVKLQLSRFTYQLPKLEIKDADNQLDGQVVTDLTTGMSTHTYNIPDNIGLCHGKQVVLHDYYSHPAISAPVAV